MVTMLIATPPAHGLVVYSLKSIVFLKSATQARSPQLNWVPWHQQLSKKPTSSQIELRKIHTVLHAATTRPP